MGNNNSTEDSREEIEFEEKPVEILPDETRTDPDIVQNLEEPLSEEKFNLGVTLNIDDIKVAILKRSDDSGKQMVYRDTEFPADVSTLYFSPNARPQWENIEWKQPSELSVKPRLLKDGVSSDDIIQGSLGNCWWLSSCAAIARQPKYMYRVIPSDQPLVGKEYVGMIHFRFWRFGSWVDVIIDDRLPTLRGRLVFGRSSDEDEFWLPLLEKAYAKLHGSYEAIVGGVPSDGLEDLTGGMAVVFELGDKTPSHLFKSLVKSFRHNSFACCSIKGGVEGVDKATGLVSKHAYTLTGAQRVPYKGERAKLVRIRNPWGNEVEWNGSWSDGSDTWDEVDASVRKRLGYADKDNGEWWMDFSDFKDYFSDVTICTMGPDFDSDGAPTGDSWLLSTAKGKWLKDHSAGGSRNNLEAYATNPQYYIEFKEPDEFDAERDEPEEEGKCSVVMGLMQEYRRVGKSKGLENLYLSLNVFKVEEKPSGRLGDDYFRYHRDTVNSGTYRNLREVNLTAELDPGHYVIIPSSFYPDKPGSFLIRVFTEKPVDLQEI